MATPALAFKPQRADGFHPIMIGEALKSPATARVNCDSATTDRWHPRNLEVLPATTHSATQPDQPFLALYLGLGLAHD